MKLNSILRSHHQKKDLSLHQLNLLRKIFNSIIKAKMRKLEVKKNNLEQKLKETLLAELNPIFILLVLSV
jgi:hypothetical protein